MKPVLIAALCLAVATAATVESQSASAKIARLESGRVAWGSRIDFTPGELNSWVRDEARELVPQGVRNLRLTLAAGAATGSADIDFLELRRAATGEAPGWVMKNLFAGERPVTVTAHFESRNGRARVDVDSVQISGVPIEGAALDFLIENYLRPTFPTAKVGEWFGLDYRVDHFAVSPAGMAIYIGRPSLAAIRPR